MKKVAVEKKTRNILAVVLLFLILASAGGLYWSLVRPGEVPEEYTAFSYTHGTDIDYRVFLQPNELFPESSLESGMAYFSEMTDYIGAKFVYRFSGQKEARVKGEYSVVAAVAAQTGEERKELWKQDYILLPPKSFDLNDKDIVLEEDIRIPFFEYYELANMTMQETNVIPEAFNLTVSYNLEVDVQTEAGEFSEVLTPAMIIPLKGKVFTIGGNLTAEDFGDIKETRFVPAALIKETKIVFGAAVGLWAVLLIVLLLATSEKEDKTSSWEKKLSSILKKHRERLVTCEKIPSFNSKNLMVVSSFEELLKAADELEVPVHYYQNNENRKYLFFVLTETDVYKYSILAKESDYSSHVEGVSS